MRYYKLRLKYTIMSEDENFHQPSTPPPLSEEGTSQRQHQLPAALPVNMAMAFMANTFKDTMCEMMAKMSEENQAAFSAMIKTFRPEELRVRISDVYFPSFDPDKNMDVKEWVNLISRTQQEYKLKDHEVRLKAASVLKGRAQSWADECLLRTTTWTEMREDMLQTFEPESRYFSDVLKFRRYSIDDADSIPEYISNIWKMFKKIVKPNPTEQDAVEFVIGSISDDSLRTELLNSKSSTVPELIAIAKTIRKRKAPTAREQAGPYKKPKIENRKLDQGMTCFVCGKPGHRARWCDRNAIALARTEPNQSAKTDVDNKKKVCSYCSKPGHSYENCFKRLNAEKNVNLCQKGERVSNIIIVTVQDQQFEAMFDSGADCSLVKESIASKLPGLRKTKTKK